MTSFVFEEKQIEGIDKERERERKEKKHHLFIKHRRGVKFNQAHGLSRGASIYCFFVDQYVKLLGYRRPRTRADIFVGRVERVKHI